MKILVIRFSSIGDIVLTTPVLRGLKQQVHAEVHVAVKRQFQGIVAINPNVDKVHCLDGELKDLIQRLKAEKFDCIVDLHHNLRSFLVKRALGIRSYSFDKLNFKKWLYVTFRINILPPIHIVDRYYAAVRTLGVKDDGLGLDYFIPAQDEVDIKSFPEFFRAGFVVYAIGGQHFTKRMPPERIVELCKKINQPVILLGGSEDAAVAEEVIKFSETGAVLSGCGKYNLNQSASIVRAAGVVFTHDTGIMHIAAALQKKVVAIWGNTVPAFGMYPYRTSWQSIENHHLSCRPCSKIGFDRCPRGHFKCMRESSLEFDISQEEG